MSPLLSCGADPDLSIFIFYNNVLMRFSQEKRSNSSGAVHFQSVELYPASGNTMKMQETEPEFETAKINASATAGATGMDALEYIARLDAAHSFFESGIRARINGGVIIRDRSVSPHVDLEPGTTNYAEYLPTFIDNVCSKQSVQLLHFLYKYDQKIKSDFKLLRDLLPDNISEQRLKRIEYDFPRLDQTAIADINAKIKRSSVAYRLDDLSRIGLIMRSDLGPPDRKHSQITQLGIEVVNDAVAAGRALLAPLF